MRDVVFIAELRESLAEDYVGSIGTRTKNLLAYSEYSYIEVAAYLGFSPEDIPWPHSVNTPSTILTIRFADFATPRSCVIITMVFPISFSSSKSFRTSFPLA